MFLRNRILSEFEQIFPKHGGGRDDTSDGGFDGEDDDDW